jgi:hypothetical protein
VPTLTLTPSATSVTILPGGATTLPVSTAVSGGFSAPVSFSISGLPAGVTASFSPASLRAPGSGSSVLRLAASASAAAGTYAASVNANTPGYDKTTALSITILPAPSFTLSVSAGNLSVLNGGSGSLQLTSSATSTFNSSLILKVTGMPTGMTAKFTPALIAAPGSGSSALLLSVGSSVTPGSYTLALCATGAGLSRSVPLTVKIPSFTLILNPSSLSLAPGGTATSAFSTTALGGFNSPVSFALTGLPAGIISSIVPVVLAAPGSGTGTIKLTASSAAAPGIKTFALTATGGGVSRAVSAALILLSPVSVSFGSVTPTVTIARGSSRIIQISTNGISSFHSAVTLKATDLPTGITAAFAPPSIASPGLGNSSLTLSVASSVPPKSYLLTIIAAGSTTSKTMQVVVAVQ